MMKGGSLYEEDGKIKCERASTPIECMPNKNTTEWIISYKLSDQGNNSYVYFVKDNSYEGDNQNYIVKYIVDPDPSIGKTDILNEICIQSKLEKSKIVPKIIDAFHCNNDKATSIIMEFAGKNEANAISTHMKHYIEQICKEEGKFEDIMIKTEYLILLCIRVLLFIQIMFYKFHVVHGDLHLKNIMVTYDTNTYKVYDVKIIDFGNSIDIDKRISASKSFDKFLYSSILFTDFDVFKKSLTDLITFNTSVMNDMINITKDNVSVEQLFSKCSILNCIDVLNKVMKDNISSDKKTYGINYKLPQIKDTPNIADYLYELINEHEHKFNNKFKESIRRSIIPSILIHYVDFLSNKYKITLIKSIGYIETNFRLNELFYNNFNSKFVNMIKSYAYIFDI